MFLAEKAPSSHFCQRCKFRDRLTKSDNYTCAISSQWKGVIDILREPNSIFRKFYQLDALKYYDMISRGAVS